MPTPTTGWTSDLISRQSQDHNASAARCSSTIARRAPTTSPPSTPAIRTTTVWWSSPKSRRPAGAGPGPHGTAAGRRSLLFSFALIDCGISSELLSLTCAVGVAEAIGQVGGCRAGIKWPNDVLLDGKKVAGILVESKSPRTEDRGQRTDRGQ